MPLPLPSTDNRRYADLVEEARTSIPALHPGWTDHNPSDPGITLVELFAWLTEAVVYRTNQTPDATHRAFLRLLRGPSWPLPAEVDLAQATRETIAALRTRERGVTPEDYETMVMASFADVARVKCVPERSLAPFMGDTAAPAHMSVVVVPSPTYAGTLADLLASVRALLHPRRLLTTRLQVVGPTYLDVPIKATLALKQGFEPQGVAERAASALNARFHPLTGGREGEGWPFGRDVHVSEIHALLDEIQGVDFVTELELAPDPLLGRLLFNDSSELVGVRVLSHELVHVDVGPGDITFA